MRILKQSHSVEKLEKGDPLGFLKLQFAAKCQKTRRGDPLETKKLKKKSHSALKNSKDKPYSPVRFCMLRGKKEKPFWFHSLGQ